MKFLKNLDTRQRAMVVAVTLPIILFFCISPLSTWSYQALSSPVAPKNIKVVQKSNELDLLWDKNKEFDLKGYRIQLDRAGNKVNEYFTKETSYLITGLENGVEYRVKLYSEDDSSNKSSGVEFNAIPNIEKNSFSANIDPNVDNFNNFIVINLVLGSVLLLIGTLWALFFKIKKITFFTIGMFPSLSAVPFLGLSLSLLLSVNATVNKFIFSTGVCLAYGIGIYLLLLTVNILNTSVYVKIPLEQAAKASQFIFSLITSYLTLIFVYGSELDFILKLIFISSVIFYFSYSCIWFLREISLQQVLFRSLNILFLMSLAVVIFSVWPVNYVYAMLSTAVIFYILLSMSLEMRTNLTKYVWLEYSVLILLITVLLVSNSVWGINGLLF